MPRVLYVPKRFHGDSQTIIAHANEICADYRRQGYDLTLRQLYYQFVARDLIENSDRSYKRLGSIVNDARLAGELDWRYIIDRTRNLAGGVYWEPPEQMIETLADGYQRDYWTTQPAYIEVWIEKDALVGVLQRACWSLQVPYFSCRGYTSQSEMWSAAQRLRRKMEEGKAVTVFHLGDHDPSGIDMTRDITDRLTMFIYQDWFDAHGTTDMGARGASFRVERIALTMDQIYEINPPPNPAKMTDARAQDYVAQYGYESWELDALEPSYIDALVNTHVRAEISEDEWDAEIAQEATEQDWIRRAAEYVRSEMGDSNGD